MRAALAGAIALVAPVAAAHADPLQDQVLAGIRATRTADIGFTMTTHVERTGAAARDVVARYQPGAGWTLVSIDGRAPTAKERRDAARQNRPPPAYGKLADWFGSPAVRVAQTPASVTYRFVHLPAGSIKMGDHDVSASATAEALVDLAHGAPHVARVRIVSAAGFRIMLVAKVDRFTTTISYAPLPDGRVVATATDVDMAGSLLGKAGTLATRTRYTDFHAAR